VAKWINRVVIASPTNGTTTRTADPASGTTVVGSTFTPTAGNLLVCVLEAAVTSTTPSGWTLPTGGSAVNITGIYVWWKVAAGGGGDGISTVHNGTAYPAAITFMEFPAGSSFVKAAAATAVANTSSAGPTISALTGTNLIMGALGHNMSTSNTAGSVVWGSGVEDVDTFVVSGINGYLYSLAYLEDSVLASTSMSTTVTITGGSGLSNERLIFAVQVAAAAAAIPPMLVMQTRRAY